MAGGHGATRRHRLAALAAVGLVVCACSSPTAESEGPAPSASPESSVAPSTTELFDIADRDPLPFPGYSVTRVTIAPLPGVESLDDADTPPPTGWAAFDQELVRSVLGGGSDAVSVAVAIDGEIVHTAAFGARVPTPSMPSPPTMRSDSPASRRPSRPSPCCSWWRRGSSASTIRSGRSLRTMWGSPRRVLRWPASRCAGC